MLQLLLLSSLLPLAASQCTFPESLQAVWTSSSLSTLTFNNTHVGPLLKKKKTLSCFKTEGTKYVMRSAEYSYGPYNFRDYTCLDLQKVSDYKYTYNQLTDINPEHNGDRVIVFDEASSPNISQVCNVETTPSTGRYSIMIRGAPNLFVTMCPDIFINIYKATLSGCDGGAILDVCTDNTTANFNFTSCGGSMYSGEVKYNCIYSVTEGSSTYITLYSREHDTGNTNPFIPLSCAVIGRITNGNQQLTHAPGDCQYGQTSINVTSPGIAFSLQVTSSCGKATTPAPEVTPPGTTAGDSSASNSPSNPPSSHPTAPPVNDGTTRENATAVNISTGWTLVIALITILWKI